jgi:hypothetical protein
VTLCVYALVPRASRIRISSLQHVSVGAVTALVREARPPQATAASLRRHAQLVDAVAASGSAVLPVRFGTCVGEAAELIDILRSRQDTLRKSLRAVRGRVQMIVRLASEPVVTSGFRVPGSGAEYLRARAAARAVPQFDPLRVAVRRWVKDERIEKHDRMASIYHLIPRSAVAAYRGALARAAAAAAVRVVVTGPYPPYAFATPF